MSGRMPARMRPTLRLRLTLLNGILLIGAGAIMLALAWILIDNVLHPADSLVPGTEVTLADGTRLAVAEWQDRMVASARAELLAKGLLALIAIGLAGIAGAYVVAGRALRPLHQVTSMAQRLGGETLDQRIRYAGANDEVAELAATFDAMLDRLTGSFESQKRFVANASHELRTPLAVMRTEIDVTLSDDVADIQEYRRMAMVVRDASERANGLVDALLILARSEAQGRQLARRVPFDLTDGVHAALSAQKNEMARLKLDVATDLPPAVVTGDPGLLERLAGNLIENAVRYNHLHGRLWVRTEVPAPGLARLVVGNTGFEVEQVDVPGLFEPFRRGGRERTGARGSGLGLSIVRAVCEAHGGTVGAVAQAGGGLVVTVTLPGTPRG